MMTPAPPHGGTSPATVHQPQSAVNLFGVRIHSLDMHQAIEKVRDWLDTESDVCRYVVTPNVDHAVQLQEHRQLRDAYAAADLVLADGHPIVWASRILRKPLPERVPGSDLVPKLFASFSHHSGRGVMRSGVASPARKIRVFLLGAAPGVGVRAARNIVREHDHIEVVGVYSPPLGFENNREETELILGRIVLTQPDLLIVGLGAPKQECWVHAHRHQIQAKVALCVGATIDFLAGEKRRAPRWMQKTGVEWVHRMLTEPRRLVRRYLRDAWIFPRLVIRQWIRDARPSGLS